MFGNGCNPLLFDFTIVGPIHKTWRSNRFEASKNMLLNNIQSFNVIYQKEEVKIYKKIISRSNQP